MSEIKLKGIGKKEIIEFHNLKNARENVIKNSSKEPIFTDFSANKLSSFLHPSTQHVIVTKIINETPDIKTFILAPDPDFHVKTLAYFQAGQYISLQMKVAEGIYRRPYFLSSSPKKSLQNEYSITVKEIPDGIVSTCLTNQIEVGDKLIVSGPIGVFTYNPLRDAKHVIALIDEEMPYPIISMAESILDGTNDFNLTILYNAKEEFIFKNKFDDIASKTKKVNIKYLEDNLKEETLSSYLKEEVSVFVSGSIDFLEKVNELLKNFNLPLKSVRTIPFKSKINLKSNEDYNLIVRTKNQEISLKCNGQETLLDTMEKNGILTPSRCHVGECGYCRSKLISGKVKTFCNDVRVGDKNLNYIHPCISYPESDVVIELPN